MCPLCPVCPLRYLSIGQTPFDDLYVVRPHGPIVRKRGGHSGHLDTGCADRPGSPGDSASLVREDWKGHLRGPYWKGFGCYVDLI